jgi:hypothetical protein
MRWKLSVAIAAVVALAVMGFRLHRAQLAHQAAVLRADSLEAANDRQRELFVAGLTLQARRIVQMALARDSVDRALKSESRARYRLGVTITELRAELAAGVVEDSGGNRSASFHVRQAPYTVDADVALPAPPSEGTLALGITLDTLGLRARIGCGEEVSGVRPATFYMEGPTWASFHLLELEQDPAVCNAEKGLPPSSGLRVPVWALGPATILGYILGRLF